MDLITAIQQPSINIVDVREPLEFFFGHAKNALNIPLSQISAKVDDLQKMEGPIFLYCASGNRSGQAEAFLKSKGLRQVYNVGGLGDMKALLKMQPQYSNI
jgi:phage shock protein E